MADPEVLHEVDRLVAEASAQELEEVWTAVRTVARPDGNGNKVGLAFMGTFRTKKGAIEACQRNAHKILTWSPRGNREDQFKSDVLRASSFDWQWTIAKQEIQDE